MFLWIKNILAAYFISGHGKPGCYQTDSANLLCGGRLSVGADFVGEAAAKAGVKMTPHSRREPLVSLKYFATHNPATPTAVAMGLKD